MVRPVVYPYGAWPLEMRAETAAGYCDEPSVEAFLSKVEKGVYSSPIREKGCLPKWHRLKLDRDIAQPWTSARRSCRRRRGADLMPRRKPQGWPRYMVPRRLKRGGTAFYWRPPTWAIKKGLTLRSEALGSDYTEAKRRCDDILNPQFDAWRRRDDAPSPSSRLVLGSFDWMVSVYKSSPKYKDRGEKTRRDYDASLNLISRHVLKDGRTFGSLH
jgi:hypothetical protein